MCIDHFDYWSYDLSQIQISYFMTSGIDPFDADSIVPLASVQENLNALLGHTPTIMVGADHNIVKNSFNVCGYVNAWF